MELTYYSLNKYPILFAILILIITTISIVYIKINSMNTYYEKLNVPIPFYFFIGNKEVVKKIIDTKIYDIIENKNEEGFSNINNKSTNNVKYYYITDLINDIRTFIYSLIYNTKNITSKINTKFINTQKNIQNNTIEITDKLYSDFLKPKINKMIN